MQKALKILIFCFFLVSFLILGKSLLPSFYPDFGQYYFGFKEIIGGINPYASLGKAFTTTTYPPLVLFITSPLSLLPMLWAEKTWAVMSIIFLFSSVYLIFKIYKKNIFSGLGFIILGLVCFSFPVKFTLGMGQINNLILFLFVFSIYFLEKKKNYLPGFLLSLSIAIKFFPIFFPLYFFFKRKWRILFSAIISFIVLAVVAFIINPQINLYFYNHVLPVLLGGWKTEYYNQSIVGFVGRSFTPGIFREVLKDILSLVFILISCFVIFKSLKNKKLQNMHLGLLVTLNLIVNNFSWQHHFVFMLLPFLVTLFFVQNLKNNLKFIFIILISYVLISFNLKNPDTVPILLQSHVFYGAVLLWILQIFLIWKDSRRPQRCFPSAWKR